MSDQNRYGQLIEHIFLEHYEEGVEQVTFERADFAKAARELKVDLPKNLGDIVYSFRYRRDLPRKIQERAPKGLEWIIRPAGRSRYTFVAVESAAIMPNEKLVQSKIPDATPGIITLYALSDEQALLAKLRYNRMVDIFTGVTCYSLQNHLRTSVPDMGQVETDEIYIGVDNRGAQFVFPVQAKGGNDALNVVQIEQDLGMCADKFPALIARPVAAQFMEDDLIALFELEQENDVVAIAREKHYRLVPPDEMTDADLQAYRERILD